MGLSVYTVAGFVGVVMVLVAYFANQQRWLSAEDWRFPFVNALGSGLILVSLYVEWNFPSFIINSCWIAISLYGLVKGARGRMSS
jgi:paired small multidrug resistance pump